MPETGRTIFCFYTLRAAETGGPLGGGADCRLPEGKSKRARLRRAISILGVALMNRSNRIDHIRLTSHPDPNAKVRFPIHWGASSVHERGPIIGTVSRPQDLNVIGSHGGVVRALPSASSILRYARSDPAAGSDKYIPSRKDRPFSAMDGAAPHCVHGSLGTSGRGDLPVGDSR